MSRIVSLAAASALSLVGLIVPFLYATRPTGLNQSLLLVMMLGIIGAFTHGLGFIPTRRWAAAAISPACTWPIMALALLGLAWVR